MQTTSSPTSQPRWTDFKPIPVAAWSTLTAALIALAFLGQASANTDRNILYEYSFAIGTIAVYAVLAGVTLVIGLAYRRPVEALGLRSFAWRWVWIALGLIVLVFILAAALEPLLHGGREQGLEPERWQPEHARAFALNGLVVATVVPFTEELFFRGLGIRVLSFLGGAGAVVVTALAFGLSHGILGALPPLVFFALALGWVRVRSESIWPCMLAHGFYNGVGILVTYATLA